MKKTILTYVSPLCETLLLAEQEIVCVSLQTMHEEAGVIEWEE